MRVRFFKRVVEPRKPLCKRHRFRKRHQVNFPIDFGFGRHDVFSGRKNESAVVIVGVNAARIDGVKVSYHEHGFFSVDKMQHGIDKIESSPVEPLGIVRQNRRNDGRLRPHDKRYVGIFRKRTLRKLHKRFNVFFVRRYIALPRIGIVLYRADFNKFSVFVFLRKKKSTVHDKRGERARPDRNASRAPFCRCSKARDVFCFRTDIDGVEPCGCKIDEKGKRPHAEKGSALNEDKILPLRITCNAVGKSREARRLKVFVRTEDEPFGDPRVTSAKPVCDLQT